MGHHNRRLMGFVAIALAVVLAIYLSAVPSKKTQVPEDIPAITAAATADINPAAGDVVPGGVGSISPMRSIYATEADCKKSTGLSCRYVKCPEGITMGSNTTDVTKTTCLSGEQSGWRGTFLSP